MIIIIFFSIMKMFRSFCKTKQQGEMPFNGYFQSEVSIYIKIEAKGM